MNVMEVAVSACLGFLSALLVEYLINRHEEKGLYKSILEGIKTELDTIKERLLTLELDVFYINPLDMSYWESIIHSDSMNSILKHPLYKEIVNIYQCINNVNQWENIRSNAFFLTERQNAYLNNAIECQRKELYKEVEQLLHKLRAVK